MNCQGKERGIITKGGPCFSARVTLASFKVLTRGGNGRIYLNGLTQRPATVTGSVVRDTDRRKNVGIILKGGRGASATVTGNTVCESDRGEQRGLL